MVEAAMIFPLVIACVAAVISIVISMYQSLSLQSSLHLSLRNECGEQSQTVYRLEEIDTYPSEKDRIGFRAIIRMEKEREYRIAAPIFRESTVKIEEGRSYLIDEPELIRIFSFQEEESE